MSRWLRRLPTAVLCAFLLLNGASALAYYSTSGTGSGSTSLPTITGPSAVTVTQSGATITVSWTAAMLSSGTAVQGYQVTRSDGTTICGSPTVVTSLSCTDAEVSSGTYTYTVKAIYHSWDATATSASFTVLTAPTITAKPPSTSNSVTSSFSFSGGSGSSYQCQLDGGAWAACASPASYSGLSQGSHSFDVEAVNGTSTGPVMSYTWSVDGVAPTQTISLASGASGAYLSGSTLYYRGTAAGSFKLTDTVSDGGSGPVSAAFPDISANGWTHAPETITTPSGGPYTSSSFSWSATPSNPSSYTVTGADAAGNTAATTLSFTPDNGAPTGGALTVNGTAATPAGSTSQATNGTSFTIAARTDYTDNGSGLKSSVLTIQSESLTGSACGSLGSGGPFTSATTISGTAQPAGIVVGYCYVYTLTGTDNVGNVSTVSTTVVDNALSFTVTRQPASVTAGVGTAANAVVLTAMKNGATDTTYTGATLSWSGAANSPSGSTPTLPTSLTWTNGVATFGITLVNAQTTTLTVTDGTRSATFTAITVNPGAAFDVAWTNPSSSVTLPSPCFFTCTYASGFGASHTWSAYVSITDSQGNVVSNLGAGHVVVVTLGGNINKGTMTPGSPATITLPSSGAATSATQVSYTSVAQGNYTDTLTATSVGYTSASASFSR
jgi:hypothetical protein